MKYLLAGEIGSNMTNGGYVLLDTDTGIVTDTSVWQDNPNSYPKSKTVVVAPDKALEMITKSENILVNLYAYKRGILPEISIDTIALRAIVYHSRGNLARELAMELVSPIPGASAKVEELWQELNEQFLRDNPPNHTTNRFGNYKVTMSHAYIEVWCNRKEQGFSTQNIRWR